MQTFTGTVDWLGMQVELTLDPPMRWGALGVIVILGFVLCAALLAYRDRWWWLAAGALAAAAVGLAGLSIPNSDVLEAVPSAHLALWSVATMRNLAVATSIAGLTVVLALRGRPRAIGGAAIALGMVFALAQVGPMKRSRAALAAVGPLPCPTFQHSFEAQLGVPIERRPSVIHGLVIGEAHTSAADERAWQLERPVPLVTHTLGFTTVMARYRRGPVRLATPVRINGIEDRGPAAWPLAVGDELRMAPTRAQAPTRTLRVVRTEIDDGFVVYLVDQVVDGSSYPLRLVRRAGGLYETARYSSYVDPEKEDTLNFKDFLIDRGDGSCDFDGMACACRPRLSTCHWSSPGTTAGLLGRIALGVLTVATSELFDKSGGEDTSGELVVLSQTGS